MAGNGWREVTLGDVCSNVRYGFTASAMGTPTGTRFLRVTDVATGNLDWNTVPYCEIDDDQYHRFCLQHGDIVIARMGTIGVSAFIDRPVRAVAASYLIRHRIDETIADPRFVSYVLRSPLYWQFIDSHGSAGAVQPNINAQVLASFKFPLPPLPEQRAIAHVLGALDDKIELNRRMNATLEAMARALFKSWFVDFDPVRAKSEGRDTGLPSEVAALFPDRLVDSALGEIPEGWAVKRLGEVVDVVGGTTPSTKVAEYWERGTHCWATPKDLSNLSSPVLLDTERKITDAGLEKIGSGLLRPGALLLSSRAPIGYLAVAEAPVAINQGFIGILPGKGYASNLFMLYWCETFQEEIVSHANGSTFPEISKSNFRRIPLVMAAERVMTQFDRYTRTLYERIVSNEREARALAAQRDLLLPGLVSGEVRVNEVSRWTSI